MVHESKSEHGVDRVSKSQDKAIEGGSITKSQDNDRHEQLKKRDALRSFKLTSENTKTGEKQASFTIDMGNGIDVKDKRVLRADNKLSVNGEVSVNSDLHKKEAVKPGEHKSDHHQQKVEDKQHEGEELAKRKEHLKKDIDEAAKTHDWRKVIADLQNEQTKHPQYMSAILATLNSTLHEHGVLTGQSILGVDHGKLVLENGDRRDVLDAHLHRVQEIEKSGAKILFDDHNHVTAVEYPNHTSRHFKYDAHGLSEVTEPNHTTYKRVASGQWQQHDAHGHVGKTVKADVSVAGDGSFRIKFDDHLKTAASDGSSVNENLKSHVKQYFDAKEQLVGASFPSKQGEVSFDLKKQTGTINDSHGNRRQSLADALPALLESSAGSEVINMIPDQILVKAMSELLHKNVSHLGSKENIENTLMHATSPSEALAAAFAFNLEESHGHKPVNHSNVDEWMNSANPASLARKVKELVAKGSEVENHLPDKFDALTSSTISQGSFGNCKLEAAISSLCNTPEGRDQLRHMITPGVNGSYVVKFPGADASIVVPAPTLGERMVYAGSHENGLAMAILDKAYGQYIKEHRGSNSPMPGEASELEDKSNLAMELISGKKINQTRLSGDIVRPRIEKIEQDLGSALAAMKPVTAEILRLPTNDSQIPIALGDGNQLLLEPHHAYGVLAVQGNRITLYDPHCVLHIKDKNGHVTIKQGGTFEISVDQFQQIFSKYYIPE